jgi:hypothetical protein
MNDISRLPRIRLGVRAVLTLAIVASIAANILHANPDAIARSISAWPPLALLLAVELISRVPVHGRWLPGIRLLATAAIAGIAAWVSYWHMVEVARTHGESVTSAHLIPLSVDGLIVVTSICLVEIGGRLAATGTPAAVTPTPDLAGTPTAISTPTPTATPNYTPTPDPVVAPPVAPTPTPVDAPDPTATPTPAAVESGTPTEPDELAAAADRAMVRRLQRDIAAGRLKASPGVEAIRKHLKVGNDRARRLRDVLQAETPATPGRHAASTEKEAAHA